MPAKTTKLTPTTTATNSLFISPTQVIQGEAMTSQAGEGISRLGKRPLVVGGNHTLDLISSYLNWCGWWKSSRYC